MGQSLPARIGRIAENLHRAVCSLAATAARRHRDRGRRKTRITREKPRMLVSARSPLPRGRVAESRERRVTVGRWPSLEPRPPRRGETAPARWRSPPHHLASRRPSLVMNSWSSAGVYLPVKDNPSRRRYYRAGNIARSPFRVLDRATLCPAASIPVGHMPPRSCVSLEQRKRPDLSGPVQAGACASRVIYRAVAAGVPAARADSRGQRR